MEDAPSLGVIEAKQQPRALDRGVTGEGKATIHDPCDAPYRATTQLAFGSGVPLQPASSQLKVRDGVSLDRDRYVYITRTLFCLASRFNVGLGLCVC